MVSQFRHKDRTSGNALSWGLVALALSIIITASIYAIWPHIRLHTTLKVGDGVFSTQVVRKEEGNKGNSFGAGVFRQNEAVLFVYSKDAMWSFSTEGMKKSSDIVWINQDKEVVYIVKNVSLENNAYVTYQPRREARYILQLPVGTVANKSINIDSKVIFDENNFEGYI